MLRGRGLLVLKSLRPQAFSDSTKRAVALTAQSYPNNRSFSQILSPSAAIVHSIPSFGLAHTTVS
jgi:hypothetical protein